MKKNLMGLFKGCMEGRTMYVIPYCMGPPNSPYSKFGVEITDSAYVVVNMKIMCHIGTKVLRLIDEKTPFLKCLHSVGKVQRMQRMFPGHATLTTARLCTSLKNPVCGRLEVDMEATHCWARSAMPCALHPPWPAKRAGWQSIA